MSEKHYGGSYKKKKIPRSQQKKMIESYTLGDQIRIASEKTHKTEQQQAEEELTLRLSNIS